MDKLSCVAQKKKVGELENIKRNTKQLLVLPLKWDVNDTGYNSKFRHQILIERTFILPLYHSER